MPGAMKTGRKNVCEGAAKEAYRPVDISQFRHSNGSSLKLFAQSTQP